MRVAIYARVSTENQETRGTIGSVTGHSALIAGELARQCADGMRP
jgi:DNA invertase Pin-like site-specific DNA recombinase